MHGRAALVLLIALPALAACGGPAGTPAAQGTRSTGTSAPPASSSSQPAHPCTSADLGASLSDASADPHSGEVTVGLVLTDTGRTSCVLSAVPQVRAYDPKGTELPNSPAATRAGVHLSKTLAPGGAATLTLAWLGTGQGSGCGANHYQTVASVAALLQPGDEATRVDAGSPPASVQGICWVDDIEVEQAT